MKFNLNLTIVFQAPECSTTPVQTGVGASGAGGHAGPGGTSVQTNMKSPFNLEKIPQL